MDSYRECLIEGCKHHVPPANEVDAGVGIVTSNEPPICEECYISQDPKTQEQIKEIEERKKNGADDMPAEVVVDEPEQK